MAFREGVSVTTNSGRGVFLHTFVKCASVITEPTLTAANYLCAVTTVASNDQSLDLARVESETICDEVSRDIDDGEPINTVVMQGSTEMPTASATEMVIIRSRSTEIRQQQ